MQHFGFQTTNNLGQTRTKLFTFQTSKSSPELSMTTPAFLKRGYNQHNIHWIVVFKSIFHMPALRILHALKLTKTSQVDIQEQCTLGLYNLKVSLPFLIFISIFKALRKSVPRKRIEPQSSSFSTLTTDISFLPKYVIFLKRLLRMRAYNSKHCTSSTIDWFYCWNLRQWSYCLKSAFLGQGGYINI